MIFKEIESFERAFEADHEIGGKTVHLRKSQTRKEMKSKKEKEEKKLKQKKRKKSGSSSASQSDSSEEEEDSIGVQEFYYGGYPPQDYSQMPPRSQYPAYPYYPQPQAYPPQNYWYPPAQPQPQPYLAPSTANFENLSVRGREDRYNSPNPRKLKRKKTRVLKRGMSFQVPPPSRGMYYMPTPAPIPPAGYYYPPQPYHYGMQPPAPAPYPPQSTYKGFDYESAYNGDMMAASSKKKKRKKKNRKKKQIKKKPVLERSMTAKFAQKKPKTMVSKSRFLKPSKSLLPVEYRTNSNRNYNYNEESEEPAEDDDEEEDLTERDRDE